MKIAYLFFAYKNPVLMKQTIGRLACEDAGFFIHIDAKVDIRPFETLQDARVAFAHRRIPVYWGEFSGVEATLQLVQQAIRAPERYDYFVLMSGSEYPLRTKEYIHSFFASNRGAEYMSIVKMPNSQAGKPISRINTRRLSSDRPVGQFVFRALARLGLAQRDYRKHLGALEAYAGHTWWTLSREACQYALDFGSKNPHVPRFFKDTFAPEETYFHTILGNSPFLARMRRNLFFEDWSDKGSHPEMISESHLKSLLAANRTMFSDAYGTGEVLFARKFSDSTLELTQKIDELTEAGK